MPAAFEKARKKSGAKVRTVTRGPNKGKLIAIPKSGHPAMGAKREHKRTRRKSGGSGK